MPRSGERRRGVPGEAGIRGVVALHGALEQAVRPVGRVEHLAGVALFERVRAAGAIRPDVVVDDIGWVLEMVASVRLRDARRTAGLRERYLALLLDGLRAKPAAPLPGPPPTWAEISERWNRPGAEAPVTRPLARGYTMAGAGVASASARTDLRASSQ